MSVSAKKRVGKNGGVQGEEIFCPRAEAKSRRSRLASQAAVLWWLARRGGEKPSIF